MLVTLGHEVAVFTSGVETDSERQSSLAVYRVESSRTEFSKEVLEAFAKVHAEKPFDVAEAAEYGADAWQVFNAFPEIARVVKLHTASYQINEINENYLGCLAKSRFLLGAIRRLQVPTPYWGKYNKELDPEFRIAQLADEITAPSHAILNKARRDWNISGSLGVMIPNPYQPSERLLELPIERDSQHVTFVGRIEVRKGVLELAKAVPLILQRNPDAKFVFVGRILPHPESGAPLDLVMKRLAGGPASERMEFLGGMPYDALPAVWRDTSVAVFPSTWEAFGLVCLEAMAAGCPVVASKAGGMAEIVHDGITGRLVSPGSPVGISQAVSALLNNKRARVEMGRSGRERVLQTYAPAAIGPLQEASYLSAIERAKHRQRPVSHDVVQSFEK